MILLDTNVVSEFMRSSPDPVVVTWLDDQSAETLYLSTVSLAELLAGIAVLPDGRRKAALASTLSEKATPLFGQRLVAFDAGAAEAYAAVMSRAKAAGRPIGVPDAQIAATAIAHNLIVASRDTSPFETAGVPVIDPWSGRHHPAEARS